MPLKVTKDNTDALLKGLKSLMRNEVLVGVPSSASGRKVEPGQKEPASNALIAYVQDQGSPANNIPPRPFMIPGIENAKDKIVRAFEKGATAALEGDAQAPEVALNSAGLVSQSAIRDRITSNIPPPLKEATLQGRIADGFTSDHTLVRTGQMLRSITYVIRPKGSPK